MKYIIVLLSFTIVFTQELEVDGNLKVIGNIDAQNQVIKNVGDPVLDSDATNLSSVRSMLGMKPDRIYTQVISNSSSSYQSYLYPVPSDKMWVPNFAGGGVVGVAAIANIDDLSGGYPIVFIPGMSVHVQLNAWSNGILTIYEFPISVTGSENGLNYVEP